MTLLKGIKQKTSKDPMTDEEKKNAVFNAMKEIDAILKKYGVEYGSWVNRFDVEKLFLIFKQTPNITEWKLEPQLRKY